MVLNYLLSQNNVWLIPGLPKSSTVICHCCMSLLLPLNICFIILILQTVLSEALYVTMPSNPLLPPNEDRLSCSRKQYLMMFALLIRMGNNIQVSAGQALSPDWAQVLLYLQNAVRDCLAEKTRPCLASMLALMVSSKICRFLNLWFGLDLNYIDIWIFIWENWF